MYICYIDLYMFFVVCFTMIHAMSPQNHEKSWFWPPKIKDQVTCHKTSKHVGLGGPMV